MMKFSRKIYSLPYPPAPNIGDILRGNVRQGLGDYRKLIPINSQSDK